MDSLQPMMPPRRSLRVAVIGAGPAGLVAARELRREGHAPVVVFERAAGVGGTWLYDDASLSASAEDPLGAGTGVHSSLYASLRTNLPRECMGFLDFPFTACSTGDPRRFPGHAEVLRYIEEFARRFDLLGMVRLRTEVVRVRREEEEEEGTTWRVAYSTSSSSKQQAGSSTSEKMEEEEEEEEVFDAVVVCNGHFAEPRLADIAGIDDWPGKQMHSHSYRVPDPFHDQVVVIIGYHPSGMDISRDIAAVAKEVHVAIRGPPPPATCTAPGAHANLWIHHSTIDGAEEDGSLVFQDGTRIRADAILHCTGYNYSFPFLQQLQHLPGEDDDDDHTAAASVSAGVVYVDDNRVGPLYKHVFPPRAAPGISFIGLPFKTTLFPLFELQSKWVAGVVSGRIQLPSPEEMMQDVTAFYSHMEARGLPKRYTHDLQCTFEYEEWLAEQCMICGSCVGQQDVKIEEWRKDMMVASMENGLKRMDTYRDEWDDHHLLALANQQFNTTN